MSVLFTFAHAVSHAFTCYYMCNADVDKARRENELSDVLSPREFNTKLAEQ
jgi:hypothetical protein